MTLRAASVAAAALAAALTGAAAEAPDVYRPALRTPEVVEPFLKYVEPGADAFTGEKETAELEALLGGWGARLRGGPPAAAAVDLLLTPTFRGGPLRPSAEQTVRAQASLEVHRGTPATSPTLDRRTFSAEVAAWLAVFRRVDLAKFVVTAIEWDGATGVAHAEVRFEIGGPGAHAGRTTRSGLWRLRWRRGPAGWRVEEWTAGPQTRSTAATPVFAEITSAALGRTESFRRQLATPLDAWMARIDSTVTRDTNGHHGVSVGDADGDGLEDLYVAQPSGLPNRLYRARGDGTFEDTTEQAGVGVLDDTSQALFADVDNDGDQDLVLSLSAGPALFANDGRGRFAAVPGAFRFRDRLQGAPMSMAMADYDRDGFLDLYLCVYSFYFGAGEDKAGTPMPYYDARNGPPSALFRNDGTGHFVETTHETGLDAGNDAYHFAAAWADYDADGWPDLLVANDFGRKNLYRNLGLRDGQVRFEDVAEKAGVLDHGAGMSAAWLDYDNDGRLDIYTGNMWSANGLRVTAHPAFLPDAPPEVRALYRRHARGNSLFRNRGDGTFEDVSLRAGAERGGWAWSSDALDFDSDGWDDLYVANGMITRAAGPRDLDGFFWRQVVARSPATRVTGTPYDEGWRAMNQLLVHGSIASHQRNVLLRNDGQGAFDDVSATAGLDLEQDGRSFAVFDADGDGDPDLAVLAARSAPQLRLFRNDLAPRGAALAVRLVGRGGNRDAVGARVTVETDLLRRTKVVQAGSGFLSQHSKELLFGLGASSGVKALTVEWPSGRKQEIAPVPLERRILLEEGGEPRIAPMSPAGPGAPAPDAAAVSAAAPPSGSWLYEPFPAPDFSLPDLGGTPRSLGAWRGRPAVVLFWTAASAPSRAALRALAEGAPALAAAGVGAVALALDPAAEAAKVRAAAGAATALPVVHASDEVARSYAIVYRHLFMNKPDLPVPAAFLLDADGQVVKVYRGVIDVAEAVRDAASIAVPPPERLARAVPFPGTFHTRSGARNYLPYGRELLDQGLEQAAVAAFERAAEGQPAASTLYRLGTLLVKSGEPARARAAFERALAAQPDLSEASNDLGALLAQGGDLPGAIARFRAALAAAPDYPDALNNLGYALLLSGEPQPARALYEKALALQPDFPEALNNLGLIHGREGELDKAEVYFRRALAQRADYGEAANNLALVLVARRQSEEAIALLRRLLEARPDYESAYVTLARIYLAGDRRAEGLQVLERLLQRNPRHPLALEIVRDLQPR